jgi:hypothetical protein
VAEYPLPGSSQTHEVVSPAPGLLLISQQTDGCIVKVALDPATGRPLSAVASVVSSPWSGLHGLSRSTAYPGMVWATVQFESALLLMDPVADDLDQSSRIFRLQPDSGNRTEIAIDPALGTTPVGLVAGPDGNVWFVLLGGKSGGTGAFGRIEAGGTITPFHLRGMLGQSAALIHLAFGEVTGPGPAPLYLLGSTMGSMMALDAVHVVTLDSGYTRVAALQTVAMATPMSMTHRVLPMGGNVFVTAMACALTHLTPSNSVVDQNSDSFSDFGVGLPSPNVAYTGG